MDGRVLVVLVPVGEDGLDQVQAEKGEGWADSRQV